MTDMNTWKREDWLRWLSTTVIPQAAPIHGLSPAQQASAVHAVESSIPNPSDWTYKLVTPPTPEGAARPGYPDLSEDYPLEIVDIGHSSHTLILSSDPLSERITRLQTQLTQSTESYDRLKQACIRDERDIQQTLGKALGYPWFKDDQKNFPGATEDNGVCVGEHVATTLAAEAATRIETLERELAEAKASLHNTEQAATSLSWAKAKAENERNDMFCQLTAANATIAACKAAGFITADGVIALPGTFVYAKWWGGNVVRGFVRHEFHGNESCCFVEMTTTTDDGRTIGVRTFLSDCYSTREAAAAKEAQ